MSGVRQREVARGCLADQPIVHWLIQALDQRIDATARLWSGHVAYALHVRDGVVVALESPEENEELGQRWTERALLRATAIFALSPQTRIEVGPLDAFDAQWQIDVPPLQLITRGLRALAGAADPDALVRSWAPPRLAVRRDAPVSLLGLLRFEMLVVDALRERPRSFDELAHDRLVHPRALSATLFVLHELRFLEGNDAPPIGVHMATGNHETPACEVRQAVRLGASVRREPNHPKQAIEALMPTTANLEARLQAMAKESYFEMLGVSVTASQEEVRSALAQRLFQYHPDRLPPEHKRLATLICARLSGAAIQLCDADTRARHMQELGLKHHDEEEEDRGPAAADILHEADRCIRKRDFRAGEALLLRGLEAHRGDPRMTAQLAWCQAEAMEIPPCGPGERTNRFNHQLRLLRGVVKAHPKDVRARYYFAQLLKRSGRFEAGLRQFEIVVTLQPQNIGAARELRLHEMRQRRSREAGVVQRLLDKKSR